MPKERGLDHKPSVLGQEKAPQHEHILKETKNECHGNRGTKERAWLRTRKIKKLKQDSNEEAWRP